MNIDRIKVDFDDFSNSDLINYIFKRHHAFLKDVLASLSERILTLYEVYYQTDGEFLEKIHSLFAELRNNLEAHMIKEERSLFLKIKDYENNYESDNEDLLEEIHKEIYSVERNNNEIEYLLKEIRRVTDDYTYGTKGHTGYDKIYSDLQDLERETYAHLDLEKDLIFKRLKEDIK